jgi:hypothetical protein
MAFDPEANVDPASNIVFCAVNIHRGLTTGPVILTYGMACGTFTGVLFGDLSLEQGETYYIAVKAKNRAGLWSEPGFSNGIKVDATEPSAPGQVTVRDDGVTTTQLHVAWTPSTDPETGIAGYEYAIRQDSPTGPLIVDFTSVGLATEVTRAGSTLTSGNTYFFGIRARNGAGTYSATRYSDGLRVSSDMTPPQISQVGVSSVSNTGARITWTTDEPATSAVDYGTTNADDGTVSDPTLTTFHSVTLGGLNGMTTYHFRLRSVDQAGNAAQSTNHTLDTLRPGPSLVSVSGRQLMVRRRRFEGTLEPAVPWIIRGVTYSPASSSTNTSPTDPNNADVRRLEFAIWAATDLPLIKAMKANTIRTFIDPGLDEAGLAFLDACYRNGLMVILTVDDGVNDIPRAQSVVTRYRDHPAILMWSLGSEWNINRYFGVASSVRDAAQRTETAAALIKTLDANHPVASSYGEIDFGGLDTQLSATQDYVTNVCPSVDVWSLNLYRGSSFGALWSQWPSMTDKPMFLGEFGVDAYDVRLGMLNEALQAEWDVSLWNDIARNLSATDPANAALGGTLMGWSDEWWKVPPPGSQETGGWKSAAFPDGVGNEEYFGVMDIDRRPRQVYDELMRVFDPAYVPPPETFSFDAVSRGAAAAEWVGQYGFTRFVQNGTPIYAKNGGGAGGRGFNIAAVNAATGKILNAGQNFDTFAARNTGTAMNAMVDYLESLPTNTLVLVAIADDAGLNSDNACGHLPYPWVDRALQAFESLGSTQVRNICFRGSFVLAAVKGEGVARGEQQANAVEVSVRAVLNVP